MMSKVSMPSYWKETTLGEIGSISGGGTPSTKVPEYWDGEIFWLVPSVVTKNNGLFISQTERRITPEGLANSSTKLMPSGTVLMTSRATIGEVVINSVPMATNQGFINIRCGDGIIFNEFLAYWIKLHKRIFEDRAHGVTFKEITKSNFKTIPIFLPPLPEQRAIASALRTVQEAKEARQRELTLERERKAALMQYLFTHGTRGEARKQTEIGEIPESWDFIKLGEVCSFTTGKLNSEAAIEGGQYPFFTCSKETFAIDSYSFDQEAILLAGNNAQGVYSVKHYKGKFDAYQRTYVITVTAPDEFDYSYLLYDLSLKLDLLRRQSLGALTKFLTGSIIRNLNLSFPSIGEQQIIASALNACGSKITALENEERLFNELFKAMLEKLMTGQLSAVALIEAEELETSTAHT